MNKLIKTISVFLFAVITAGVFYSCTDLEEEIFSSVSKEEVFADPDNLIPIYLAAYSDLYTMFGHKYAVGFDCGTDLLCVPQRGGDWEDGGEWHRYHRLTWNTKENYISRMWNVIYQSISACNVSIDYLQTELEGVDVSPAVAELKALRAFYHWKLLDLYGNVIIADTLLPPEIFPSNSTKQEVYDFIEKDLISAIPLLSKETGIATFSRINYYGAYMTLAKLYLNAEVYTGAPEWNKASIAIDSVLNGNYHLSANVSDCFEENIEENLEVIWGIPFDQTKAAQLEIHVFTLHYVLNDLFGITEGPWNGLTAQESLYDLLAEDVNDERLGGLLYGEQYNKAGVQYIDESYEKYDPLGGLDQAYDPDFAPLNLTPEINMLEPNCLRQAGARIQKYPFLDGTTRYMSNDHPIFRLSDAMLMKAEVLMWINGNDNSEAIDIMNEVRQRSNAAPLSSITPQILLDERARELFIEGFRRSDLIRFEIADGTHFYTGARWEKPEVSPSYVMLWPIPQNQIDANSSLTQNTGY